MPKFISFKSFVYALFDDKWDKILTDIEMNANEIRVMKDYALQQEVLAKKHGELTILFDTMPHELDRRFATLEREIPEIIAAHRHQPDYELITKKLEHMRRILNNREIRAIHPESFKYVQTQHRLPFGFNWSSQEYSTFRRLLNAPGYMLMAIPIVLGLAESYGEVKRSPVDHRMGEYGQPSVYYGITEAGVGTYTQKGLKEFFGKVVQDIEKVREDVRLIREYACSYPLENVQVDVAKYDYSWDRVGELFRSVA